LIDFVIFYFVFGFILKPKFALATIEGGFNCRLYISLFRII